MYNLLYIDDQKENTDSFKAYFSKHFAVQIENCPITAYEKIKSKAFDVIIIDVLMPILDGVSLYKKLLETSIADDSIIIFKTASLNDEVKLSALGFNKEVLTYNMSDNEKLLRIKNQISKSPLLRFGENFIIDKERIIIKHNNTVVPLTLIEYKMFLALSEKYNQAISKEEFINRVWGDKVKTIEDNTINSHLSNLRKKVRNACKITKIRDKGFMLSSI